MKTSIYALIAVASLAMAGSAAAADLGGNCCADLEERVAELEATTARKGNRKMSLTISGHVNKAIMHWSANAVTLTSPVAAPAGALGVFAPTVAAANGSTDGTYLGVDNQNSSTRFGFAGSAAINPEWKAGFSILIDVVGGARSNAVSQATEDTDINNSTQFRGDYGLRMRDANWYLESSRIGRATVGRLVASGAVGMIDLGGIGVIGSSSIGLIGGGFLIGNAGFAGQSFNNWTDNAGDYNQRVDGVKWTSPTLAGFTFGATIGETLREGRLTGTAAAGSPVGTTLALQPGGRIWGIDARYANEFNGVRFAAGIGYERGLDEQHTPTNVLTTSWGASMAMLHTATGLFVQGDYLRQETSVAGAPNVDNDANKWQLQAGITKNFFGIGNTSLYGEYARSNDWLDLHLGRLPAAQFNSKVDTWGLGVVQVIDAAATELYLGYRNHSFSAVGAVGIEDFSTLVAGARIKF
jgi:hypothetical protein